jgi:ABC-type multidrug transport system fused ATPase/permease subunit
VGYSYFAAYYRESAREMKRLDSALRSLLYSHFAESLSGLATIRAYGETERFIQDDRYFIDLENRALFLTITNQVCIFSYFAIKLKSLISCLALALRATRLYGWFDGVFRRHHVCCWDQWNQPITDRSRA